MAILHHPLFLVALTAGVFQLTTWLYEHSGRFSLLQPVLITTIVMIAFLFASGISFADYWDGTSMLHLMLGPAIVALAIPLHDSLQQVGAVFARVAIGLLVTGSLVVSIGFLFGYAAGFDGAMLLSLLTRSVTMPIAIATAEKIGGELPITVVSTFTTGLVGAVFMPTILRLIGPKDERVRGFTLGLISHAFGVARALEISPLAAAFGAVAMVSVGCLVALAVPLIVRLFG